VDPALAAAHPLEVLDHVGHVHLVTVEAGLGHRPVEQRPGRADERAPGQVLAVPGLFAGHHDPGPARAFAEHGLRPGLPQWACLALGGQGAHLVEGGSDRGHGALSSVAHEGTS
jgi:hypothetical protein